MRTDSEIKNFKVEKLRKTNIKAAVLKENKKRDITIDMFVTWRLNICLLILCIHTCEHYTIAFWQNTSK